MPKWLVVLCILVGIALGILLFRYNPSEHALFPKCPFYSLSGLKCPGCGSLRAAHQLLHGRIGEAFRLNAALVISLPYLLLGFGYDLTGPWRGLAQKIYRTLYGKYAAKGWAVALIAYWALRNIFGF